jgi:hypothetical protein
MLEEFVSMINQADMLNGCTQRDDSIIYEGEEVAVKVVEIPVSEKGDYIRAIFHTGTDTLIDMNIQHKCTCGCKHSK